MFANSFRQIGSSIGGLIPHPNEEHSSFDAFGDERARAQRQPGAPPRAPGEGTATQRNVGMNPENTDALSRAFLPGQQSASFAQLQGAGQARPSPEVLTTQAAHAQAAQAAAQPAPEPTQATQAAPVAAPIAPRFNTAAVQSLFVPADLPGQAGADSAPPNGSGVNTTDPAAPATAAPATTAPPLAPPTTFTPPTNPMPDPANPAPTLGPPTTPAAPKFHQVTGTGHYTPDEVTMIQQGRARSGLPPFIVNADGSLTEPDAIAFGQWQSQQFPMPAGTAGANTLFHNGGIDPAIYSGPWDGPYSDPKYQNPAYADAIATATANHGGQPRTTDATGTTGGTGGTGGTGAPGAAGTSPALSDMFGLQARITAMLNSPGPYGTAQETDAFNTLNGQLEDQNGQDRRALIEQMAARGLDASTIHGMEAGNLAAKQGRARNDLVATIHQRAIDANEAARQNAMKMAMGYQQTQQDNTYRDTHDQSAFLLQLAQMLGIDNYTGGATNNPFSGIDLKSLGY